MAKRSNHNIEIILLESVQNLGIPGDFVQVAKGYFRNYLAREGKAVLSNDKNRKFYEERKERLAELDAKRQEKFEKMGQDLKLLDLKIVRPVTPEGKLYKSVGAFEILAKLRQEGFAELSRQNFKMFQPLQSIGDHEILVDLHPRVSSTITVTVESQF